MRAGAYTIHQSLTAEAAAVLKLALGLARRRGHAQVTPLHVAFALLSTACTAPAGAAAYGLLKRACLRSHPAAAGASPPAPAAHYPLQCRALELCFNVALNRLPTSGPHSPPPPSPAAPPPFASSLIQPNPTLSNALVAALKRAQANQRRGCVELQQQQPPPTTPPVAAQQQQQPLLAIKVELDQLIISILDDPSVSRVMREAGFSSATVKSNLEEESALIVSSSSSSPPPPAIPPHFFLDPSIGISGGIGTNTGVFGLWPAQFLTSPSPAMVAPSCKEEDVAAVLEVMVRKQGRRTNPVVVGDSVSMAEAVAGELLRRLERGDVPEELAGAHLLKLQLSYVHVRLMSRADVDAKAAELRRSVDAVQRGGLVIYVGDLRWALDEEAAGGEQTASSYSPVEHMVSELGRLLGDLRAGAPPHGRVWVVATASYQTYMRCQHRRRRPSLESAWALQVVVVPTGSGTGLALNNLHSSSSPSNTAAAPVQQQKQVMATKPQLAPGPFGVAVEPMALAAADGEQEDKLVLCTECGRNYEREAAVVKAEADGDGQRVALPGWLLPAADQAAPPPPHEEKYLVELKRKWSRLCRKLHLCGGGGHTDPCSGLAASPIPWWSSSCLLPSRQSKPSIAGFLGMEGLVGHAVAGHDPSGNRWSPPRLGVFASTALALHSLPHSDSATSGDRALGACSSAAARELERRLRKDLPWQPAAVSPIVDAIAGGGGDGRKGAWLFFKGGDHAAHRRAAAAIAKARCGSADRIVSADPKLGGAEGFCSDVVSRAREIGCGGRFVLVVGDVDRAAEDVAECLVAASKCGSFKDQFGQELDLSESVVILMASGFADGVSDVISLQLSVPEESSPSDELKRKTGMETTPPPRKEPKRPRHDTGCVLDLNLSLSAADDDGDDEDAVPSDITDEGGAGEHGNGHGGLSRLLASIAADVVTFNKNGRAVATIRSMLAGAVAGEVEVRVDDDAAEALAAASGGFLEETLERWVAEVFAPAARARSGGKTLALGMAPAGGGARDAGFMGSALPSRVHVD